MSVRSEPADDVPTDYDEWVRELAADARGRTPETIADTAVVGADCVGGDVGLFLGTAHEPETSPCGARRWPKDVLLGRATDYPYPESYPTDLRELAVTVLARDVEAELNPRTD